MGRTLASLPPALRHRVEAALAREEACAGPGRPRPPLTPPAARQPARVRPQPAPGRMNKAEARYAAHLEGLRAAGEVRAFAFESLKFRIADDVWYTPDFYVERADGSVECHEVKARRRNRSGNVRAHLEDDARVKIRSAAARYPGWRFLVVSFDGEAGRWEAEEVGVA